MTLNKLSRKNVETFLPMSLTTCATAFAPKQP
jgi:hypothetical protein